MIKDSEGIAAVAQAEYLGVLQEDQKPWAGDLKRHPVPPRGSLRALRLAREQGELGAAAVRGDHQRSTGVSGPAFGPRHGLQAQSAAVPGRGRGPIRDEELDVIKLK